MTRLYCTILFIFLTFHLLPAQGKVVLITDAGAIADGRTNNQKIIQSLIDQVAEKRSTAVRRLPPAFAKQILIVTWKMTAKKMRPKKLPSRKPNPKSSRRAKRRPSLAKKKAARKTATMKCRNVLSMQAKPTISSSRRSTYSRACSSSMGRPGLTSFSAMAGKFRLISAPAMKPPKVKLMVFALLISDWPISLDRSVAPGGGAQSINRNPGCLRCCQQWPPFLRLLRLARLA